MKRLASALVVATLLAGCGARGDLKPPPGEMLPVKPYGAPATPTPADLLKPGAQARPDRSDELLKNSEERGQDPFDLPPPN
ncbi:LPS translocon maturation chaperone LptM [Sphingomonas sp.]|uniref:LPS translocon maturation chaperone LptM n=1 Tax=Sphingomonas sp. TaxID=28214 RepID=UPI002C64C0DF|nr:lipoprotein [Sphingomonas sp.]HWK36628.1 lipoprotein [Sphingomonas sp.]